MTQKDDRTDDVTGLGGPSPGAGPTPGTPGGADGYAHAMATRSRERGRDPVVEAFRRDVDVTLLEENLERSVEERFLNLMEMQRFAEELRRARREAQDR